ncbi:MAG TPA: hypothetical protein VE442_22995 [Jatrophihabitans sp.]|nr:hypothetical protein [Jatrophihabitans sp.]
MLLDDDELDPDDDEDDDEEEDEDDDVSDLAADVLDFSVEPDFSDDPFDELAAARLSVR